MNTNYSQFMIYNVNQIRNTSAYNDLPGVLFSIPNLSSVISSIRLFHSIIKVTQTILFLSQTLLC